jgi:two-component system cell cycle sensor histidine kinase/response regulator CckA
MLIGASILLMYYNNKNIAFFTTYQKNFLLRFFPSFFVVLAYSYLYEYMTEKNQEELRFVNSNLDRKVAEQTIELKEKNISLNLKIEQYKIAQDALQKSEERFRDLADLLPQTVFELDDTGHITFANRMAFSIFGYTQEDFDKGLNALQMFIPEDRDKIMAYIQRVLGGEMITHIESAAQKKNGNSFPVLIYPRVILHKDIPAGIRGILIDITAQKEAEENRRNIEIQLQKSLRMATLGQVASGLLHEIHQPLSGIYGHVQLLQLDRKLSETHQERLQTMLEAIERMTRMMDQFRSISGPSKKKFGPVSLKESVHRIRNLFEHQIRTNNIRCSIEIQEGLPPILGDANGIQQIISNLMNNAIHALEDKEDGSRDILIKTQHRADTVVLDFEDTGCGMPEDVQAQVFELFFTTKASKKGSGLGMVIVETIVHKYEATINFESKVGVGTRLSIEFPVAREKR